METIGNGVMSVSVMLVHSDVHLQSNLGSFTRTSSGDTKILTPP